MPRFHGVFSAFLVHACPPVFTAVLDKPYLDLTSTRGQGILAFQSALAQDERDRIVNRAQDGGRPPRRAVYNLAANLNRPSINRPRAFGGWKTASPPGRSPATSIAITPSLPGYARREPVTSRKHSVRLRLRLMVEGVPTRGSPGAMVRCPFSARLQAAP
jgi:hypothetical protein